MNRIELIAFQMCLIVLFSNIRIGAQWMFQESGTQSDLRAILFIDENTGWAAGNDLLLYTTDGGDTWNQKSLPGIHNSIYFSDMLNGWVCGENGVIYKTTDGGVNWALKNSGTISPLTTIIFSGVNDGFAAGYYQTILKTTDGGETWFQSVHNGYEHFLSGSFIGSNKLMIAGTNGSIFVSSDSGLSWDSIYVGMPNGLYEVEFLNADEGFIFGCCGSFFRSVDGGSNWEDMGYITEGYIIYSAFFTDEFTGWAVGEAGYLLKTTDKGNSWFNNGPEISENLLSVFFINDSVGYVCGTNGLILKTENGGMSTVGINNNEAQFAGFILEQNYPNPFNPSTNISFTIPAASFVTLGIYDMLGNEISKPVNEFLLAGKYNIEVSSDELRKVGFASGVYFYRIVTDKGFSDSNKMILLK